MLRLNNRQWSVLLLTVLFVMGIATMANRKAYSMSDITKILNSMESTSMVKQNGQMIDNKDPEVIAKHKIEVQVNDIVKSKLNEELKLERDHMNSQLRAMKNDLTEAVREAEQMRKERDISVRPVQVDVKKMVFDKGPEVYRKHVYSFRTRADSDGNRQWDSSANEFVILSSFTNQFGGGRTFEDFFKMVDELTQFPHPRTSISLLIGDNDIFHKIDRFVESVFKNIGNTEDISDIAESFSKVTLLSAPFLENKLDVPREERQKAKVQKDRRRTLSQMRNFLVTNGVENELYTLFVDSDMIELPKDMLKHFLDTDADIATVRVDMKTPDGRVTHPDYDLNAWAGTRIEPDENQEKLLDIKEEYVFVPKDKEAIHMLDLSANRDKFGLDESPAAKYELRSVGGAVLWAKANIYRQGALFPPYYVIGTKWERREGWDGIETEGLCYVANAMGYKCWGFPNMVAYHTV